MAWSSIPSGSAESHEATSAFEVSRLRAGEVISGLGGGLLIASASRGDTPAPLRWLLRATGLSGLALAYFQGARRAPALPAALSVVVTALGWVSALTLIARRLPGRSTASMLPALLLALGGLASLREEGGPDLAEFGPLETIDVDS